MGSFRVGFSAFGEGLSGILCNLSVLFSFAVFCVVFVCYYFAFRMSKEPPAEGSFLMTCKGQRICPGWDGNAFKCGRFMSHASVDPHTLCSHCRRKKWGRDCTPTTTCWQCKDWPQEQWDVYNAKSKYSDRKKSKTPNPSPVSEGQRRSSSKTPVRASKSPSVGVAPSRSQIKILSSAAADADSGVSPLPPVRKGSSHRPASPVPSSPVSPDRSVSVARSTDRSVGQSTMPSGPEQSSSRSRP